MRKLILLPMLLLAACAAPDEHDYCDSLGLMRDDPEYANCTDHYFKQTAAFSADRAVCDAEADTTYPPTLYDTGSWTYLHGGYWGGGRWAGGGWGGSGWGVGHSMRIPPDYRHNAEVDRLRMNIIQPCMEARGWNSGADWKMGRKKAPAKKGKF